MSKEEIKALRRFALVHDFRTYAIAAHGDQRYGPYPYAYHLAAVESEILYLLAIADNYVGPHTQHQFIAAAWLHDSIEDTPITKAQLEIDFGQNIADLVWAVTGEGVTRREKFTAIQRKINLYPQAALLKLADRIANIKMSLDGPGNQLSMYLKEQPLFEELIRPNVSVQQWKQLADLL